MKITYITHACILIEIDKIKIIQQPANINSRIIGKNSFYQKSPQEINNIRNKIDNIFSRFFKFIHIIRQCLNTRNKIICE